MILCEIYLEKERKHKANKKAAAAAASSSILLLDILQEIFKSQIKSQPQHDNGIKRFSCATFSLANNCEYSVILDWSIGQFAVNV
jgi:hypothetical protein